MKGRVSFIGDEAAMKNMLKSNPNTKKQPAKYSRTSDKPRKVIIVLLPTYKKADSKTPSKS